MLAGDWGCFRLGHKGRRMLATDLYTDSDWHRGAKNIVKEIALLKWGQKP